MQKSSRIPHRFSYLMFSSALSFSGSAEENSVTNQKGTSALIRKQITKEAVFAIINNDGKVSILIFYTSEMKVE